MKLKTAIVWFKTDLRLYDNETLCRAIECSEQVVPVYCFDESHFQPTKFGYKKTGNFRAKFLLESLVDLDQSLKKIGSGLLILKGKPEVEITKLAKKHKAEKVFAKEEIAPEEIKTEKKVKIELQKINCQFEAFNTHSLYKTEDLPFSLEKIPDIFTQFRKQIEKATKIRPVFHAPEFMNSPVIEKLHLPSLAELGLENVVSDSRTAIEFKGGETQAKKRLAHYLFQSKAIATYKETRNQMVGENYSSKFSAWLALGCFSAREIYYEIKNFETQFGANDSTYWLVFELLWREYFWFVMKKYQHKFFLKQGIKNGFSPPIKADNEKLLVWIEGTTGNNFIDANMIELKQTGFMSNRGRQNVASYFCHKLKIDWRFGAAYFEQQLIDYDVSSNWCNWAYLAGVGNDPRENRVFNAEKQANEYDKDQKHRNLWLKPSI